MIRQAPSLPFSSRLFCKQKYAGYYNLFLNRSHSCILVPFLFIFFFFFPQKYIHPDMGWLELHRVAWMLQNWGFSWGSTNNTELSFLEQLIFMRWHSTMTLSWYLIFSFSWNAWDIIATFRIVWLFYYLSHLHVPISSPMFLPVEMEAHSVSEGKKPWWWPNR